MLNKIPPQMIMQLAGVDIQTYNQVMNNIKGKTPEQIHEYTENIYKNQGRDINQSRQDIINKLNQFGLSI